MHVKRAFVVCVNFFSAAHGDTRTGNRCKEGLSRSFTVQLNCSVGEWIHVEQEAYGDGDAATCRLKYDQSCSKVLNSNQNGLIVNCNGKQSCHEAIAATPLTNCNFTDAAAEVNYTCIEGSLDMCSTGTVRTTANGSLYLHSPGYPGSVGVNSSCVVRITGKNMRVTLVEERMKTGLLNISGDGKQFWTSVNGYQYNRVLPGTAAEVEIVYDNHDQNGSNVWIRVNASGQMNITSKRQILNTTTTPVPTSTLQPSRSQSTTRQSTLATSTTAATAAPSTTLKEATVDSTTKETTASPSPPSATVSASGDLIVAACAASGVVLTVVVITIVLCRRKQRRHASESAAPSNTYFVQFLTITTGSTKEVHDTGTTTMQADTRPEHDLYSKVLPKSFRFKRGDNKECEKDTEMMDNCLYSPSKKELIDESTDDANIENTDTCLVDCDNVEAAACCMMENDIYCSGPATPETPANNSLECGDMPKEQCCMIENDIYSSGETYRADTVDSMMGNDLNNA